MGNTHSGPMATKLSEMFPSEQVGKTSGRTGRMKVFDWGL